MILSHRHRFIFFCNGKTGTTSLEQALEPYQEGGGLNFGVPGVFVAKHVPPAILRACLPADVWNGYFKFVFVRNPWDWFVSQWKYNRERVPRRGFFRRLRAQSVQSTGRARERSASRPFCRDDVDRLFRHLRHFRGLPGADGLYQSNYVLDADGRVIVDHVGRFENLAADVDAIAAKIGIPIALEHLNQGNRTGYRDYFTPESRDRVAELWAGDIKRFAYRF